MRLSPEQARLKAAYDEHTDQIKRRIIRLRLGLRAHRAKAAGAYWRDYGHVGDVAYINAKLSDIGEFMGVGK
jgi:hypothetical protein